MRRSLSAATLALLLFAPQPLAARRHPSPAPTATPSPAPVPTPTPAPEPIRVERLRATVRRIAAAAPGRLGVAILDLYHDTRIDVRGDTPFVLENVEKLPIAMTVYRRADQHVADLDGNLPLTPAELRRDGSARTFAQTLVSMLLDRDRYATGELLEAVGGTEAVAAVIGHLGIRDFDALRGRATPNAVADMLAGIAQGHFTKLDSTNEFLQVLSEIRTAPGRFRAGLPPGTSLAHIAGSSATVDGATESTNDAGLLTFPDGRRIAIVAFLAGSHAPENQRDATLARLARAVYETYAP